VPPVQHSAAHAWLVAAVLAALPPMAALAPGHVIAQGINLTVPIESLEVRARRDSNDAAALYRLGLGYWSKKRYDDAERVLRVAVAIEPRFAEGWLALSVLPFARRPKLREEQARGKVPDEWKPALEEADRSIRRAFLIDPLVDLRILGVVDPPQSVMIRVVRGHVIFVRNPFAAFEQGRYLEAFISVDQALHGPGGAVPRDSVPPGVLWFHALCAAHLERDSVAIDDLRALLDRAAAREQADSLTRLPLRTNDYRYLLGMMYQHENRWFDAIALYRAALENDLGLYMAHVQLYRIYKARGFYDSATVESRAAVVTNPEDPSLLLEHGIMLTAAGQLPAAEDTLRRAMDADPRDSRVPYFLGLTLQLMNRPADARAAFERFLALAPSRLQDKIADARQRLAALR
jgi:tetratricopeptide (TPR) repeat protein